MPVKSLVGTTLHVEGPVADHLWFKYTSLVCVVDIPARERIAFYTDGTRLTRWVTVVNTDVCDPVWHVLGAPGRPERLHAIQYGNERREPDDLELARFARLLESFSMGRSPRPQRG